MSASKYKDIDFSEAIRIVRSRLDEYQPVRIAEEGSLPAAVMILFVNKQEVPHLIFTKRTELVEHHKGQISFPGGMKDPPDTSLQETAIRETHEEIGVNPEQVEVLGQVDDFLTITDFLVRPFVGILQPPLQFSLSENEVDEVLEVPLSLFLDDSRFEVKEWEHGGRKYDVYFYNYYQHVIWGATGFIVNRFIDIVFGYNPAPNPIYEDPRNVHYLRENRVRGGSR